MGVVPFIILSKVTSQETKYVELIAAKLAEDEDEKINFIITNELMNLSTNPRIEKDMIDKNLSTQLSFYLWAESKLNSLPLGRKQTKLRKFQFRINYFRHK